MPSNPPPSPGPTDDREPDDAPLEAMRQADIANGEKPDEENSQTAPAAQPATGSHPTGDHQARENQENDPPA